MYLLFQIFLPEQGEIEVIGPIWTHLRTQEAAADDLLQHNLQRLSVAFIQSKQHGGEQHDHHAHDSRADAERLFEQKEKRDAEQRTASEAQELPLREIEQHLAFHF